MQLISHLFILIFLPSVLLLYYGVFKQSNSKVLFLLFASLFFYTVAGWQYTILLLCISGFTYIAGRKKWYAVAILINLSMLVGFKLIDVDSSTVNQILQRLGINFISQILEIGLPLGISFYVFRHIGYILDLRANRYSAEEKLLTFLTFSFYFPQVSAGPISNYNQIVKQFSNLPTRLEHTLLATGLIYISYGFAKKVLIADQIQIYLNSNLYVFENFTGLIPAWYLLIAYAIQIYFDFSGYTDIALGVSMLFGINLPINFNNPYLAKDVKDFWKRWHISLSNWFRYYLFYPLSRLLLEKWGNTQRNTIQYSVNIITMSLIGLWHGATWGYVFWGLYHGLLLNINTYWNQKNFHLPNWLSRPIFLISILLGWAIFISPNWFYFRYLFENLTGFRGVGTTEIITKLLEHNATIAMLVALPIIFSGYSESASLTSGKLGYSNWQMLLCGILLALSILGIQQGLEFVYIQF